MPLVQVLEQFHTVSCEVGSRGLVVCALTRNAASRAAAHCVRSCTCINALFLRHICAAFEPCVCLAKARSSFRLTLVAIACRSARLLCYSSGSCSRRLGGSSGAGGHSSACSIER